MNAGLLAVRQLAATDEELQKRLIAYTEAMEESVLMKAADLEERGTDAYLSTYVKK